MSPAATDRSSPLTATALIGIGSVAALAMGVVTNKVYALVLGPSGVGIVALLLSMVSVGALASSLGMWTSVAQIISTAEAAGDERRSAVSRRVARRLTLALAMLVAAAIVVFREEVARWTFGTQAATSYLLLVAPALVLTALAYVETGILTGHGRVRDVTQANVFTAGIGMLSGIAAVSVLGVAGLAPAILVTAAGHFIVARVRNGSSPRIAATKREQVAAATRLVHLGLPVCATQLAAAVALLVIPVVILRELGEHEVGLFRAASTISVAYLTVVLGTLSYEYLPRIARLPSLEVGSAIDRHMRLLVGSALPLILGLFAGGPLLLEILYSERFAAAMSVLQWQLVGDLLRLPAWALAFALIARSRSGLYLGLEATAGVALIVAVPVGLRLGGLEGVGVGYAAAQGVYLVVAWAITSRLGVTAPGRLQAVVLGSALTVSASIVLGVPLIVRAAGFGLAALALAAVSIPRLYAMHRAGEI